MIHAEHAQHYAGNLGMHLIALHPRSKLPIANDWGNNCMSDPQQAATHFELNPEHNIGLALGPSGFCSLDIDCDESFRTIMLEMGIDPAELDKYPTIQGRDKGRRLLFRVPADTVLPYAKLNWPSELDPAGEQHRALMRQSSQARKDGNKEEAARLSAEAKPFANYTVFELRAAGDGHQRFDVLPPSIHPDTQEPYRWLVEGAASLEDWPTPPDWLSILWREWDRFKPQLKSCCPWMPEEAPAPVKATKPRSGEQGKSVIEEYLARTSLHEALEEYGYKRVGRRYLSPHTTTNLPGGIPFPDGQSCWIHHASDPLCSEESGKPVNAFDLYLEYEHGGDMSAACKALAKEFGFLSERQPAVRHPDAMPPPPPTEDSAEEAATDAPPPPAAGPVAKTETYRPFKALGFDGDHYFYLPRGTEQIVPIRRGSHTSPAELMALAPYEWWSMSYVKGKDGVDWQLAASDCMRMCERRGVYDLKRVRGRGAWFDDGKSVLHLGDRLIVNDEEKPISDHESHFIYTRHSAMENNFSSTPASDEDAQRVAAMVAQMNWSKPVHGALMAGWIALAPICGALKWRPHVWVTSGRGHGKSWLQDKIVMPLLGHAAMPVQGGTTEAGIRQSVKSDALAILFDEAEAETSRGASRMQGVLELARQSSSESSAAIAKGTAGGQGMSFRMRSMFLLGSINVSLTQAADESRFSVLSLEKPSKTPAEQIRFNEFEQEVKRVLSAQFCASIRARTYKLIPVIRQNAQVLAQAVAEHLGSQRIGDQFGTLLAGAASLQTADVLTLEEARLLVKDIDLTDAEEQEQASDEEGCMHAILQTRLRLESRNGIYTKSVAELILAAAGRQNIGQAEPFESADLLGQHGLRVDGDSLLVANKHSELTRMLKETPWSAGHRRVLARIPGAESCPSPMKFAGVQSRCVRIPIDAIL